MPKWDYGNLSHHAKRRMKEDASCLKILLGPEKKLSDEDLRNLSEKVYAQPRLIYSAQTKNEFGVYGEVRMHFIDAKLLMAITDKRRAKFITCYHLHKKPGCAGKCPGYPQNEYESVRMLLNEKKRLERQNFCKLKFLNQ